MRFEWDEAKNRANILKHSIDFTDVVKLFDQPILTVQDSRTDYAEERWIAIGWLEVTVAVVVYTERHRDTVRLISARKATRQEAKRYVEYLEN